MKKIIANIFAIFATAVATSMMLPSFAATLPAEY